MVKTQYQIECEKKIIDQKEKSLIEKREAKLNRISMNAKMKPIKRRILANEKRVVYLNIKIYQDEQLLLKIREGGI